MRMSGRTVGQLWMEAVMTMTRVQNSGNVARPVGTQETLLYECIGKHKSLEKT